MTTTDIITAIAADLAKTHLADGRYDQLVRELSNATFGYDGANRRSWLMPSGRRTTTEAKAIAAWRAAAQA